MISRYEAWLDGVALSSISPDILILDIEHAPANIRTDTFTTAKRNGSRIHRRYYDRASVTIRFAIRKYGINDRQSVCSDVVRWAKGGGVLQTNDRNGQRLRCICEAFPVVQSAMKWTDPFAVTFSAYALPFWEEEEQSVLQLTGTSGEGELYVPGNVDDAMVEASISANAALSSLTLSANGRTMTLSGLSVASGGVVVLTYDDEMIQSIKANSVSILDKRSGVDDLLAVSGMNSFAFTADADVDVDFKVRGLWL